jgi:hypothetical protein
MPGPMHVTWEARLSARLRGGEASRRIFSLRRCARALAQRPSQSTISVSNGSLRPSSALNLGVLTAAYRFASTRTMSPHQRMGAVERASGDYGHRL